MSRSFTRKVLYIVACGLPLIAICAFSVFSFTASRIQKITTIGGEIQFLGMTDGGTNWNPATPSLLRMLERFPKVASAVLPHYPLRSAAQPCVVLNPAPVLWFYSPTQKAPTRYLTVRCVDAAGEEIGFPHFLSLRSRSNAVPVVLCQRTDPWLGVSPQYLAPDDYMPTRFIELYDHGLVGRFELKP
jgi:hypothetical protein